MREALGQLLTIEIADSDDMLAIAVPASQKFNELADRWRKAPLLARIPIKIITVDRKGNVDGWE